MLKICSVFSEEILKLYPYNKNKKNINQIKNDGTCRRKSTGKFIRG